MKDRESGKTGSGSRALTTRSGSSPNDNPEALLFRVFLDSPISNGGRKWRMIAGMFLEFSIVAGVIAIPVWFTQRPDTVIPNEVDRGITWTVPKGEPDGVPGAKSRGDSGAPLPVKKHTPNFADNDKIVLASLVSDTANAANGSDGELTFEDGPVRLGLPDGEGDKYSSGIPGVGGPPRPQPPPERYRVGGDVLPPRQLVRIEPKYPVVAQRARIEGDVILKVLISDRGEIEAVIVSSGSNVFAQAAKQAVERWRYAPALLNGHPVAVSMDVVVRFRVRE